MKAKAKKKRAKVEPYTRAIRILIKMVDKETKKCPENREEVIYGLLDGLKDDLLCDN
jgi:hypothetical protein